MPRHLFSLVCRSFAVDRFTDNLSIFEVINRVDIEGTGDFEISPGELIPIPDFNVMHVQCFGRNELETPEEGKARLVIVSPAGKERRGPEQPINLTQAATARVLSRIARFPYTGDGVYQFRVQLKDGEEWRSVHDFPVMITFTLKQSGAEDVALPEKGLSRGED